ncbi:MAG: glycosyltransferase N-terminal domain-containing protein [Ferruginibacter sp.]
MPAKLISNMNPSLVLWVKYEYWFHYLSELKKREIPVILVSGIFRPSQPFFKWYGGIWRKMLGCFRMMFVQNQVSLEILESARIKVNAEVAGDTRFRPGD